MRELIKVKEDLNEIRYYYSLKELFDIGAQVVSPSVLEEKVQLYNRAVSNAPAQLYAYYIAYYVKNNKQIAKLDSKNTSQTITIPSNKNIDICIVSTKNNTTVKVTGLKIVKK